jgi:endonuclease YncB( thermonuclease family)
MKYLLCFSLLFFSCHSSKSKAEEKISGKVIAVKDGDTIEILYNGKPLTIRFAHVDCPEIKKHQPYGQAAKQFTSDKCFGQIVTVENDHQYDRYKRLIGVVINAKNENVNMELVKAGFAWHYAKYSNDMGYAKAQEEARKNKLGLWADNNPTPPWDWRKPTAKKQVTN